MQAEKSLGIARRSLKRSLGQNFLKDKGILKKIADFAQIEKEDVVVEVGPGEGTLTALLLERANKVVAIEKDDNLAKLLAKNFKIQISNNKLKIITGDILKIENLLETPTQGRGADQSVGFENYILVGNIPYYITGALFKKALESENQPKSITFVVQKEVAERIIAKNKKESILSISIKVYGEPQYGGVIKAGSFNPKPKVDSAIISVRNISKTRFAPTLTAGVPVANSGRQLEKRFFEILKAGFAHKRKLLIKNLGTNKDVFKKCGISEKARAENLKVNDWVCLTKGLTQ